ncbi:MAG: hypothetical protein KR126chlam2_00659, partial [Chlamydiae bacterium]|nr:hypothetical protein [Chlamydiota bacterium]
MSAVLPSTTSAPQPNTPFPWGAPIQLRIDANRNALGKTQSVFDRRVAGNQCFLASPEKAFALFQEAAAQGHANAQNNLGCFYECGQGVDKD